MILDQIDLKVLRAFCKLQKDEKTTTWKIMRSIFPKGSVREHVLVRRRIIKMAKHGLFVITETFGKREYSLITNNVVHKRIKYDGVYAESICFFADGKWSAFQI